jgi:hypothetical protein
MNGTAINVMKEAAKARTETAESLSRAVSSMTFNECSVPNAGPFHKNLGTGVALLLQSDSERISQVVAEMEQRPHFGSRGWSVSGWTAKWWYRW